MRKIILISSGLFLLLGLSACSSSASARSSTQTAGGNSNSEAALTSQNKNLLSTDYDNALPVETQLIIGTFKLEDTQNAVDAATAKELLPLWQAVQTLGNSDTTSSIEMDALYKQIQETMTPDQIAAIAAMHLTRQDISQVTQAMGLSFPGGGNFTPEQRATAQAARQRGQDSRGGGFPGGEFFGGGGPGGGGFNPQQRSTAVPGQSSNTRTNTVFLDAIIKLMQSKIQ
jgi:hypothetical protein